jgi:hypothetical protein
MYNTMVIEARARDIQCARVAEAQRYNAYVSAFKPENRTVEPQIVMPLRATTPCESAANQQAA